MRVCGRNTGLFFISSLLIITMACSSAPQQPSENYSGARAYLQNNIHAQRGSRDIKASYANWTDPGNGHIIIPVNTPVSFGRFRRGFAINDLNTGDTIYFEYNHQRMGMSSGQYISLITSPQKVNLDDFSDLDRKGIQEGRAYMGMSKKAVRIALGYPATHRTPSLEDDTWIYWRNRFDTLAVEFGIDGKVNNIRH